MPSNATKNPAAEIISLCGRRRTVPCRAQPNPARHRTAAPQKVCRRDCFTLRQTPCSAEQRPTPLGRAPPSREESCRKEFHLAAGAVPCLAPPSVTEPHPAIPCRAGRIPPQRLFHSAVGTLPCRTKLYRARLCYTEPGRATQCRGESSAEDISLRRRHLAAPRQTLPHRARPSRTGRIPPQRLFHSAASTVPCTALPCRATPRRTMRCLAQPHRKNPTAEIVSLCGEHRALPRLARPCFAAPCHDQPYRKESHRRDCFTLRRAPCLAAPRLARPRLAQPHHKNPAARNFTLRQALQSAAA